MLIDLKSIEEGGKDYNFDELSEELIGAFDDLIGSSPFSISLEIKPLGNTYSFTGTVRSEYSEACSRCGYDIDVPLRGKINEIVVIEKKRPRNTQVSQSQQNFDSSGPAVTYINEPSVDLREFLHEMMAASFEQYPSCSDQKLCESQQFKQEVEPMTQKVGHPGFEALKNLKV